jgi:tetratricopeptide (TPR) repeat protein
MKKIISALVFLLMPFAAISQDVAGRACTKELGDSAYAASQFADAITIYETVMAEQGASLPLYYNLGNAYYRTNQLGKAILNYERALRIDANDEDTKANLEFVQNRIVDQIPQDEVPFYKEWGNAISSLFPKDTWGVIGIVAFAIMLATVFFLIFSNNARGILFGIAIVCLVFIIVANMSAKSNIGNAMPEGVILDEMVLVKSSPDSSGTELTKIHEGLKVTIIDSTLADWVKIEANNGNRVVGWIKTKSMERI